MKAGDLLSRRSTRSSAGPHDPQEFTRLVEEGVPTKEYFRIRRADMRYIGRQLWKTMEKTLLSGGRTGARWADLKTRVLAVSS